MFKTKGFKAKDDAKKEVRLMILLAKSDGKIEEEEKLFLSNQITGIDFFTAGEKKEFFSLMNSTSNYELTAADVKFSSKGKFK